MGGLTCAARFERIRGDGLQAIISGLRESVDVQRCTLRLHAGGAAFPVVHESCTPPARSLVADESVGLRGQPVVEALLAGAGQVVQPDTHAASSDPAFLRMLDLYGGMGAQIVTAVRCDARLLGMISLHQLGGPRRWTAEETTLAQDVAALVARMMVDPHGGFATRVSEPSGE